MTWQEVLLWGIGATLGITIAALIITVWGIVKEWKQ